MAKTITKPSFRETVVITTMDLDDVGLKFNAQRVGPMNFKGLRNADYGKGFGMPIMPELVPLVYASLENKEYKTAKNVIKTLRSNWLIGKAGIHYFLEGIFVEDIPKMKSGRIVTPTFKILEKRLGSHEEGGVFFSDDKTIRFVPYGFKRESQSTLELSKNPGVITLVGSEENAEKLARASKNYRKNPYFHTLENVDSPQTKVAGLYSDGFDYRLGVGAHLPEDLDSWFSFGVLKKTSKVGS